MEIHIATVRAYIAPILASFQDVCLILLAQCFQQVQVVYIHLPSGPAQVHTHILLLDATVDGIVHQVAQVYLLVTLMPVAIHLIQIFQDVVRVAHHTRAPQKVALQIQEIIIGRQIVPADGVGEQLRV
ncbi:MAG TPA: hypothetical protein IAD02_03230 [Candidatus Enterousia intestinigallinarum]|uniref:Uncharacterized protein n=1 Tax=Candidatus Enterousia intestinigallinarum TaxID=2840790 RepID=A0A9D1JWH8_9PROT|nr:hypothetical protein [Candidatus Enterousia intestinigallinarum]